MVAEFGTKFIEVARTAVFAHDAVPKVEPVCGPFKYDALMELEAQEADVADNEFVATVEALGTKFNAPAIKAYEDDNEAEVQEALVAKLL